MLVCTCVVGPNPQAQTPGPENHVGAAAGGSRADDLSQVTLNQAMQGQGLALRTESANDHATGWRLFVGHRVNRHFAVEMGVTGLGRYEITGQVIADPGSAQAQFAATDWNLAALDLLPLGDRVDLFGKAGLGFWRAQLSASGQFSAMGAHAVEASGIGPIAGLGAQLQLTPAWRLRIEGERYFRVGQASSSGRTDIDLWSLGRQHHF